MIRVLLVDDHALFRKGLRSLLESRGDVEVCAEADDAASAVEAFASCRPDIVMLDYSLPGEDGLAVLKRILALDPAAKVIILSAFDFQTQVLECLQAGARGYLSKDLDPDVVFRGLESVSVGCVALEASQLTALVSEIPVFPPSKASDPLTARELEVVELVAQGLTNRDIAEKLALSPATVKAHVANILTKLGLRGRTEIASWAFAHGAARPL